MQDNNTINVMVVDDSLVIRGIIVRMLEGVDGIHVAASVADGEKAVARAKQGDIDVIVLDIEMPVMDGLTALPKLLAVSPNSKIVMASTLTEKNADISLKAMALGASDYVPKPTSTKDISGVGGSDDFRHELVSKVRSLGIMARRKSGRPISHPSVQTGGVAAAQPRQPVLLYSGPVTLRKMAMVRRPKVIAVGSSTGGPQALMSFFSKLDRNLGIPVVITQHMPPKFTTMLAQHVTQRTGFPCLEGADRMPLKAGQAILAPGGFHMEIVNEGGANVVRLNQNPPENFCRPAVDPMFRSLVRTFQDRVLAVVLTGMGSDGMKGGKEIADAGGTVIAQDEASSVVWGMPGAVATAGVCSAVLPLDQIGSFVNESFKKALP